MESVLAFMFFKRLDNKKCPLIFSHNKSELLFCHRVPRKTETVSERGGGGNMLEDKRPVMVPEFHLQVLARQAVKQRVEDAHLTHFSCSVLPKDAEGKCLCPTNQSAHTG